MTSGILETLRKLASGVLILLVAATVFLVANFVHFRFLPVHVVAYSALLDALVATAIAAVITFVVLRRRLATTAFEGSLFLAIAALGMAMYAIIVPTVIDRSLSVYILEKLEQRGGQIREAALEEILIREFFPEHRLVAIRLTEQINSGTVVVEGGCIALTQRGRDIARWTRFYRTTFLPRRREIMGQLTDDLTDPFRNSQVLVRYACDAG